MNNLPDLIIWYSPYLVATVIVIGLVIVLELLVNMVRKRRVYRLKNPDRKAKGGSK